jgi:hypothetical protein
MNRVPVLDVEEIEPLAENLRLVVGFDSQALLGMKRPEAPLQIGEDILAHFGSVCLGSSPLRAARRVKEGRNRHPGKNAGPPRRRNRWRSSTISSPCKN